MRTRFGTQKGVTLVELLVVISIIAFLAGALVVASQKIREQAQIAGTRSLIEKIMNANEQFYNDHRFYAPDSPVDAILGGRRWLFSTSPRLPADVERQEVDFEAPGMPGNVMPTTGNECMMITLVLDKQYMTLSEEHLAGPERTIDSVTQKNGEKPRSRCIIIDTWGKPLFYDCHKPEGKDYVSGGLMHNQKSFDVFSLGPDGRTASTSNNLDDDGDGTVDETDEADNLGESVDDINNWRGSSRK